MLENPLPPSWTLREEYVFSAPSLALWKILLSSLGTKTQTFSPPLPIGTTPEMIGKEELSIKVVMSWKECVSISLPPPPPTGYLISCLEKRLEEALLHVLY